MAVPDWDRYFLEICRVVASRSKDPATQIGCVIVGPAREIRSTGYNSLPRRVDDTRPERLERPTKYLWIEHAERNAIYNAARAGTATGYNSLPRRVDDTRPERLERPTKYLWIEHAERNAIYNAARAGTATEHCTLYADITPCMDCARAIVQAGIVEVVLNEERVARYSSAQYNPHFDLVRELFREAGVTLRSVHP